MNKYICSDLVRYGANPSFWGGVMNISLIKLFVGRLHSDL